MTVLQIPTAEVFVPLCEFSRYKGAWGGRGSGKSHFFAGLIVELCLAYPGLRVLCVREVQKSLKESVKQLIEDKIREHGLTSKFDCLTTEIRTPGGGIITFAGMQDHTADTIKSFEGYDIAWVEEAQTLSERSLELLRPTIRSSIRLPQSEIWFSWNPRNASDPVDMLLRGDHPPESAIVLRAIWKDNPWFPEELAQERLHDQAHRPDRYMHIWEGDYEPAAVGAIWDRASISRNRRIDYPALDRILVAVDPAVTNEAHSDEHGIVVAGVANKHGYVLQDASLKGSPREWAVRAIAAYDEWDADAIVIEVNQGGDMVRHTLNSVRPGIHIIEVRASRGKVARAEPISSLYALDRVSHVGTFIELENQMCQMGSGRYLGEGSPDRVDALVWAFTELFNTLTRPAAKPKRAHRPIVGGWMG